MVVSDSQWTIDLSQLIVKTFPVVCHMMSTLTAPNFIWPITAFMTKLLQKAECEMTPEIIQAMRSIDFNHLLASNDLVIKSSVEDMLIAVITVRDFGEPFTWLYEICLQYLMIAFPVIFLKDQSIGEEAKLNQIIFSVCSHLDDFTIRVIEFE